LVFWFFGFGFGFGFGFLKINKQIEQKTTHY